jgi:gliding motility-associated-like protein
MLVMVPVLVRAQIPTKCLEIESILVDACNPAGICDVPVERMNEMVRFRVGPSPVALSDLHVAWPNNNWLGLVQTQQTAAVTAALNATIEGCGWLVEPPAGNIPAGAQVLLVTSPNMCVEGNSFANLNDTLYIIFHEEGNSNAYFANSTYYLVPDTTSVPGPVSFRTLIMYHVPTNCSDTVTYDRGLLVNIYGNYAGMPEENDGATVEFSWPGVPQATYVNYGCQAPIVPFTVIIEPPVGDLCTTGQVQLTATLPVGVSEGTWEGGTGTFSDPSGSSTTYTAGPGDQGEVELEFCVIGSCGLPVCASVTIQGGDAPQVQIVVDGPAAICPGSTLELTATGNGDDHVWSTGETGTSIIIDQPGTYTVTASNACGHATASVTIDELEAPVAVINGPTTFCAGASADLTASGGNSYLWNTGGTGPIISVSEAGIYSVVVTGSCGTSTAVHTIQESSVITAFDLLPQQGTAPLTVDLLNLSVPDDVPFLWDLGDGDFSTEISPQHTYDEPGEYIITLTSTNGCSDVSSFLLIVEAPEEPVVPEIEVSSIIVPNVFTPNGDGNNDVLELMAEGLETVEMGIYNRWGQLVYRIERPRQVWDGRSFAGEILVEGTYFYELRASGFDGSQHELKGTVMILR